MGALARRVVDEPPVVGPHCGAGTPLDGCCREPLVGDPFGDDHLARAEVGHGWRGEAHHDVGAVLGEQDDFVRGGGFGVDHARQRLVVDDNEVGGVGAHRAVLGDDRHDGLADVAHRPDGDDRAAHRLGVGRIGVRDGSQLGEVVGGEDAEHARCRLGGRRVDRLDRRVGVRRAHVGEPGRPGKVEVLDVRPAGGQQARILQSLHPRAKDAPHRCDHRFRA